MERYHQEAGGKIKWRKKKQNVHEQRVIHQADKTGCRSTFQQVKGHPLTHIWVQPGVRNRDISHILTLQAEGPEKHMWDTILFYHFTLRSRSKGRRKSDKWKEARRVEDKELSSSKKRKKKPRAEEQNLKRGRWNGKTQRYFWVVYNKASSEIIPPTDFPPLLSTWRREACLLTAAPINKDFWHPEK